jgi:hypothetical protein
MVDNEAWTENWTRIKGMEYSHGINLINCFTISSSTMGTIGLCMGIYRNHG